MREMSAAVLMAAGAGAAATATPPHIIHMMVDDVGWNDLGYHSGSAFSPRIDALALDGGLLFLRRRSTGPRSGASSGAPS